MRRTPPRLSRRQILLGGAATPLLARGLAGCAPTDTAKATDRDTAPSGPGTVDTVIVVMMENRSFDHFFGALQLLEGRTDADGVTEGMANLDSEGTAWEIHASDLLCVPDPPHSWGESHDQFNGGACDGFVRAYEPRVPYEERGAVMGYLTRTNVPISFSLADSYALCTRYFSSVMGSTWPNRFYAHAGTSMGLIGNTFPPDGTYQLPTIWHKLSEAGVSWKYYYSDVPFLALIDGIMSTPNTGLLEDFFAEAAAGLLPEVVWIEPGFSFNDDHPPHPVELGQEFLAAIYQALANSPQWERCLLVITYDEHGGFFDHVPPPTTGDDLASEGFDQLGFRVPTLAIGPWVKQGSVDTVFDHTSWLKYVCEEHGITPWTARMAAANSLAAVLDTDRMARNEPLPPAPVPDFDYDDASIPSECLGGHLGPTLPPEPRANQVELQAFLNARFPHLNRTEQRHALARAIRAHRKATILR